MSFTLGIMGAEGWMRARSEEQIEQRIKEILDATHRLYKKHRYDEITLVMIAKEAGFTRSNLYRYFTTKEEVFLELLKKDLTLWEVQLTNWLNRGEFSIEDFGRLWVETLLGNTRMSRLFALLTTTLEPNSSLEALISFKRHVAEVLRRLHDSLLLAIPALSSQAVVEFIQFQASLAVGTYPAMNLTDNQQAAMEAAELPVDPAVYRTMMINAINYMLRGLLGRPDEFSRSESE